MVRFTIEHVPNIKVGLNRKEIQEFQNGATGNRVATEYIHESLLYAPYNKDVEIKQSDLKIGMFWLYPFHIVFRSCSKVNNIPRYQYLLHLKCLSSLTDRTKVLGSGQYGIVYQGSYKGTAVAVKTIQPGADKTYLNALLVELKVMIFIKGHKNVVELLGAYTRELHRGSQNQGIRSLQRP